MLASVLGEVCKIIQEQSGKPVSPQFKDELADRIISRALDGETDPRRLRAFALGRPMPGEENGSPAVTPQSAAVD